MSTKSIIEVMDRACRAARQCRYELRYNLPDDETADKSVAMTIELLNAVILRLNRRIKAHENAVEATDAHS
jgi:hypothetical protein